MLYAAQTLKPGRSHLNQSTGSRLCNCPYLQRASILFLTLSLCGFCISHAEEPQPPARGYPANSESAPGKRPVTVQDSIQMTRLGDPEYSKGSVAKFSPDGRRFVVTLRKGNLENNTNEYSLVLFETDEVFRSPAPRLLVLMSSSSNRPAIQNVVWNDNDTILFLGEHPGETTQLYSFRCSSKELKKLTHHPTSLTSFVIGKGGEIVFAAEKPELPLDNSSRQGITVTNELLSDLMAGKRGVGRSEGDQECSLFVKQANSDAETRITTEGRFSEHSLMALSPDGLYLALQSEATRIPEAWTEYKDEVKASKATPFTQAARTFFPQYELVDVRTGLSRLLLDAPIPLYGTSEMSWSPDSQSIALANMYLPLNIDDATERARRKSHPFLVEVSVSDGHFVKISGEDLRLLNWDPKTNEVVCDVGRNDSYNEKTTAKAYFRKRSDNGAWTRSTVPQVHAEATLSRPEITVDEDMNRPPRILAIASSGQKFLLLDLNPQFQGLVFGRVEEIALKSSSYHEIKAGLYWPVDYVAGKRYPLVIQTHGWFSERFWIDGPYSTGNAAQALAGKGFFVLQLPDLDWQYESPKELPAAMAIFDGAIGFLNRKGLIDRHHVGISGFSHTFWYVTYALTRKKCRFAAAAVADGNDYDYFQYMIMSNHVQSVSDTIDRVNGASPYSEGLRRWIKVSPAFNMDKIKAPLRIQTLYPLSLLNDWHWFVGLATLGRPVEMDYIPDGAHILEKPWDRMISQQGNVDWFCFWLKGEEDPDPAKAEQYKRWHELRQLDERDRESAVSSAH